MQVVFMKEMISVLQQPPSWLKFPVRFGTYFVPVDRRRAPSTKLPRLFNQYVLSIVTATMRTTQLEVCCKACTGCVMLHAHYLASVLPDE